MSFKKTGEIVEIKEVLCKCGGTVNKETKICKKCNKVFLTEKQIEK